MKIAWAILLISAATDFIIAAGAALTAGGAEAPSGVPGKGALLVAVIAGVLAMARTIQAALKTVKLRADLAGNPLEPTTSPEK